MQVGYPGGSCPGLRESVLVDCCSDDRSGQHKAGAATWPCQGFHFFFCVSLQVSCSCFAGSWLIMMPGENLLTYTLLYWCKALKYLSTYLEDNMYLAYLVITIPSGNFRSSRIEELLGKAQLRTSVPGWVLGWEFCEVAQYCNLMVLCYDCEQVQASCLLLRGTYSCTSYKCAIPLGLCWGE